MKLMIVQRQLNFHELLEDIMRNIINLNENWKFIQENVGLPTAYPAD